MSYGLLHYMSTTCVCMLHYMPKNDYRSGRRQVSLVVDEALWWAVKAVAAERGVSVTRLVTGLLEDAVCEPVSEPQQTPTGYRNVPDWAQNLPLQRVRSEAVASVGLDRGGDGQTVSLYGPDPLEEIA